MQNGLCQRVGLSNAPISTPILFDSLGGGEMSRSLFVWQWNYVSEQSSLPSPSILGLLFEEATGDFSFDLEVYVPNQFSYF